MSKLEVDSLGIPLVMMESPSSCPESCIHHWILESPRAMQEKSGGVCKKCGATKLASDPNNHWYNHVMYLDLSNRHIRHGTLPGYMVGCRCEACCDNAHKARLKAGDVMRKRAAMRRVEQSWESGQEYQPPESIGGWALG